MDEVFRSTAVLGVVALLTVAACSDPMPPEGTDGTEEPMDSLVLLDLPLDGALDGITASDLQAIVNDLAHDTMRGRGNLTPELEGAAAYIAGAFEAAGLEGGTEDAGEPSFFHRWPLEIRSLETDSLAMNLGDSAARFEFPSDFYVIYDPRVAEVESELYWVGTPSNGDQLSPGDLTGRIALFYNPESLRTQAWNQFRSDATNVARSGDADAVVFLHGDSVEAAEFEDLALSVVQGNGAYPEVGVSDEASERLVQALGLTVPELRSSNPGALGAQLRVAMPLDIRSGASPNVVARLPGSDPELAGTHVVLIAHFDHLGIIRADETGDSIANGADDNASGVAVLLELADALGSLEPAPPRSVLFLATSGEERGKLGAEAYLDSLRVAPDTMVAAFNFDMVGRSDGGVFHPVGGAYSTLGELVEKVAERSEDGLQPMAPEEEHLYQRSDHYEFARHRVPALWFFTGFHGDYHSPSDHPELLEYGTTADLARLWLRVVGQVAWRPEAPEWTSEGQAALGSIW